MNDIFIEVVLSVIKKFRADKAVFGQILAEFKKQINLDSIMVCDSALYSQENLQIIEHLSWISRGPMTIKRAK
jgi:transposase